MLEICMKTFILKKGTLSSIWKILNKWHAQTKPFCDKAPNKGETAQLLRLIRIIENTSALQLATISLSTIVLNSNPNSVYKLLKFI